MNTAHYCDNGYETPRSKIPIPMQSSLTEPTSIYQTPKPLQFTATPLTAKSEPNKPVKVNNFNNHNKTLPYNNSDVQFALDLVELILTNVQKLNVKISKKTLKYLNDGKQHRIVIESMLMAPIIAHLVKSCINTKKMYQTKQNYLQLFAFFIDYFQQIHPHLTWPTAQQLIVDIDFNKKSNNKHIQIQKQKNIQSICRQSIEIHKNKKKSNDNNNNKFDEFINKVNEIGNKFEILQKCTNNNKSEICNKITDIQQKQKEFGKKLNNKNKENTLISEWEKSHHHLGKKQQENIDLLLHQTQKFENIAERIKNALSQTEDPKIFESRLNFITQQTKHLEEKLEESAKNLEKSVKTALNKYNEIENLSELISIGVSPHNIDNDNKNKQECNQTNEEEKKLSFLYKMNESETGFNYKKKQIEIKNIIEDVLDCKYKIDFYKKPLKINKISEKKYDTTINIENDQQFRQRIKNRIEKMQNHTLQTPPSLSVHWRNDTNEMGFIKEKDLNKSMTVKPEISISDRMVLLEDKINVPSMDNILKKAKKNIQLKESKKNMQLKKSEKKILKKQPNKMSANNIKIISRTTCKPPELRFNSKPIQPKPIIYRKHKKIKKKKKIKHIIEHIHVCKPLISTSMQTMDILQDSIQLDIKSMVSETEEKDTVNILTQSQNNLNNFCDNVLNSLLNKNEINKSQLMETHLLSTNKIIEGIIEDIINKSVVMSEDKAILCVEEMINEQNIKQKYKELDEDIQTIVHISSTKPKESNNKIIQSPICEKYSDKLQICPPPKVIISYPVSSTSTSTSTSMSTSLDSSIATSMVSSLDSAETKQLFGNIKVTDSILSGISISESDTICGDSDSENSEEFDQLKESLNRQWSEIQLALGTLTSTN